LTGTDLSRRGIIKTAAASGLCLLTGSHKALAQSGSITFAGINLAGAEFGDLLGKHAKDYIYPGPEQINYYVDLGFNLVRIPCKWERLQPALGTPLQERELVLLTQAVHRARARNASVVLDPHNFGGRSLWDENWRSGHLIGSAQVGTMAFADFWGQLASHFANQPGVIFGLMNEPAGLQAADWLASANAAIAAIRRTGARNLILVPGVAYTGAHSWLSSGNTVMQHVQDPAQNFALEVHQYLDSDSSGTHDQAVSPTIGSERIKNFVAWARERKLRALLGEFGASMDSQSCAALEDLCQAVHAAPDVWLGWAAWAGGAWWPEDYRFNLNPMKGGGLRPQTRILSSFARSIKA
jgi:endoglucanase